MALTKADVMDLLLDISKMATATFDAIDEQGVNVLLEDLTVVAKLSGIDQKIEEVLAWVFVQNTIRMRALGIDVRNAPGYQEAVQRFLGPFLKD